MITTLSLDATGTLFRPREAVGAVYARCALRHGAPRRPGLAAELERRFRREFARTPPPVYRPGAARQNAAVDRQWWRALLRTVMVDCPGLDFEGFFTDVYAAFADPAQWRLYDDTLEALSRCRAAGLRLIVVSNFDARILDICHGLGLAPLFDAIVYSAQCGYAKPHRAIFHEALRRSGSSAATTVHVGDSPRDDALGARAAGLRAVWLRRPAAPVDFEQAVTGVPTAADLLEVAAQILR